MKSFLTSVFIIVSVLASIKVNGQRRIEFHNGIGFSYSLLSAPNFSTVGIPTITYHPRVVFELQEKKLSASIGAPLGIGYFNFIGLYESSSGITYEVPITVDLNFGYAALKRTTPNFGGFVGMGYGLYKNATSNDNVFFKTSSSDNLSSLYFHAGIRFEIDGAGSISLSTFTYQSFNETNVYGARLIYCLTDFK